MAQFLRCGTFVQRPPCASNLNSSNPFYTLRIMSEYIIGVSAHYHDSAAALLKDGYVVAAAQEERFTRKKHDKGFPIQALEYCLNEAGISIVDVSAIVYYEKPFLTFERLLETYISFAPNGFASFVKAMPLWLREKLGLRSMIYHEMKNHFKIKRKQVPPLYFSYHHLSHAASAFYPSPFESAAVLCADGVGEWATTSLWHARGHELKPLKEIPFPHSIGLLYSAFTYHCGFKVNSGEYKLMGLAPYGEPIYKDRILKHLIDVKGDGSFRLNMDYFEFAVGLKMTNKRFETLFQCPRRLPETELKQEYMDLAASVQAVTEEIILKLAQTCKELTGERNICLSGGVALNCVSNGHLLRHQIFENLWVQPAAGDAGGALGAALGYWHQYKRQLRRAPEAKGAMSNVYLGPSFSQQQIESFLIENRITFETMSSDEICKEVARLLSEEQVVGWFRGRMEYGPRALGGRSILADPRSPQMQSVVNQKVKFRESFRPLAPVVTEDKAIDFFEGATKSPYMILTFPVAKAMRKTLNESDHQKQGLDKLKLNRSQIASVTHVDNSARVQTISKEDNLEYYKVVEEFGRITGVPVLINTSFNVRGEPIVCTPQEALDCFKNTDIDYLVLENCIIDKALQNFSREERSWPENFVPD